MKHHLYLVLLFALSFCLQSRGQNNDDLSDLDRLETMIELAWQQGENRPEDAIAILLDAQVLARSMQDTSAQAAILVELGNCHYYLSDNNSALDFWYQALELSRVIENQELVASIYNNLGNGFDLISPDSSIYYYRKSCQVYSEIGADTALADVLGNTAWVFYDSGIYDSAYVYCLKSLSGYQDISDSLGICSMWGVLGHLYTELGRPDSAIYWAEKALDLSRKLESMRLKEPALISLKLAYRSLGKPEIALQFADSLLQHIKDANEVERLALVNDLKTQHEMNMKEMEIKSLESASAHQEKEIKRQNIVIISSIIGFGLLIFLGFKMMQEKKRSDNLLLNILPVKIAEELKTTGRAKARRYDSVSVIFTDFKDFSKLSDEIGPEELVEMIDEYYSAFDRIIETYGLEKIKTIGDSYMAAGGLPEPTNGHAEKAVQAALEMHTHMKILNAKKKKEGKRTFETRIGVHTGPVVAGVVGIKKFAYDIWGDTVNTANRLEKAGEPGKVNISANTYELVKHSFDCTHRGKIAIKNMGEIDMYFVG